jgi:hypothetical protein
VRATILLTLLIDPQVALLTDKALRKEAKLSSINIFGSLMFLDYVEHYLLS